MSSGHPSEESVVAETVPARATLSRNRPVPAVVGAMFTTLIDNYDIVLPVIALAPATSYFYSASWSPGTLALISSWVFAATLVGRPLGALIFGLLADGVGRHRATVVAISGCGVTMLLMGLLPGHSALGVGAIWALIALRFLAGVFIGGSNTGASPLAMESAPPGKRGLFGGIVQTGNNLGFVLVGLLTLLMLEVAKPGGPTAAYSVWGWRVPFFASAVLAVVGLVHYLRNVRESTAWEQARQQRPVRPGGALFEGHNLRSLIQVFVWMSGIWLGLETAVALLPATLIGHNGLSPAHSTWVMVVVSSAAAVMYPALGALSQRIGRRPHMVASAAVVMIFGSAAYSWLVHTGKAGFVHVGAVALLTGLIVLAPSAIATVYISERFTTSARGVGFGLGYTFAIVLPSFFATYQRWLGHLMTPAYTVVVLVAIAGALQLIGALLGPETRELPVGTEPSPDRLQTGRRADADSATTPIRGI